MRRGLFPTAGLLVAIASGASAQGGESVASARYVEPVARYGHDILGDTPEWGALEMVVETCFECTASTRVTRILRLPETRIFEDTGPRIVHLDDSGIGMALVVETDLSLGARLAIYAADGTLAAATPFIGRAHRWLAPVGQGVGDLDGDGRPEIAYVDRPHLARTLRVWRYDGGILTELAQLGGVTNHQIGDDYITGGFRNCGAGDEAVAVSADWTRIVSVTMVQSTLQPRDIGAYDGRASVVAALACGG